MSDLNINVDSTELTITPSDINLNLSLGGIAQPMGNITEVQYNGGNIFAGSPNFTFDVSSNTVSASFFAGDGSQLSNITGANVIGLLANAVTAETVSNAAQPNITSTGTLTSLTVTGNVAAGNVSGTIGQFTTVGGELTTAAQPVITSVGTLTDLDVAGNIDAGGYANIVGNVTAGNITATIGDFTTIIGEGGNIANIQGANITGAVAVAGTVTTAAQPNITSVGTLTSLAVTGNLSAGNISTGIINGILANGTSNIRIPIVDANVNISSAGNANVLVVTGTGANVTGTINATGNANVGNIGATNGLFTNVTGTLTTAAQPSITSVGTLTSLAVTGNVATGNVAGTNGVFTNVSGNGSALTAITGANVTGVVPEATIAGTVTTAAQPNITSTGTLTSLVVTGNVVAGNVQGTAGVFSTVSGNGSALFSLNGANVTGTVPAATVASTAGTVTTAAQPNITSTGTLASLTVSGNINAGNVIATIGAFSNVSGNGAGLTNILSTSIVGDLPSSNVALTVANAAQPNITSTGTLVSLVSNAATSSFNGNISLLGSNSNLTVQGTGSITGTVAFGANATIAGNLSVGYAIDADSLSTDGNVSVGNVLTVVGGIGGTLTTASQPNITTVGTLGSLTVTGAANAATLGGTLTTAAQPNITSTGTLTSLAVTGNITSGNVQGSHGNFTTVTGSLLTGPQPNITSTGNLSTLTITGLKETRVALGTGSGTQTANLDAGNYFTLTVNSTTTLAVSNVPSTGGVGAFILELTNAGSVAFNYMSGVTWAGGSPPVLTTAGTDIIGFYTYDGGTTWRGLEMALDVQ